MEKSFNSRLLDRCNVTNNRLCIGLDIDPQKVNLKISSNLSNMIDFTKDVVDATIDICPIYKFNLAGKIFNRLKQLK